MGVIAVALKALLDAGITGDALVRAVENIEAAQQPERSARQNRNARYYQARKARLEASEASETVLNKTVQDDQDASAGENKKADTVFSNQDKSPPSPPKGGTSPTPKPKKPTGFLCPEDLLPTESHFAKCRERQVPGSVAELAVRNLIDWSHSNAHRDIAYKTDWSRAVHRALDDEIEKFKRQQASARASPNGRPRSTQGDFLDAAKHFHEELTRGRDDEGPFDPEAGGYQNGQAHPHLREPAGERLRLAPPGLAGPSRPH